jgi:hypothetical protein
MIAVVPVHPVEPQGHRVLTILREPAVLPVDVVHQVLPRWQPVLVGDAILRIVQL